MNLRSLLFFSSVAVFAARFDLDSPGKIVRMADPQLSPDAKSIAIVVSRANFEENRTDAEIVLVDVATRAQRVLTHGRRGLAQPRWSPSGDRLGFLAAVDGKPQLFVLPTAGGEAMQLTKVPTGV